jgi:hypothetical protein
MKEDRALVNRNRRQATRSVCGERVRHRTWRRLASHISIIDMGIEHSFFIDMIDIMADMIPKSAHTDEFPILQIPTSMNRDTRENIEARRGTVKGVFLRHVYTAGIRVEAREDWVGEPSVRSSYSGSRKEQQR